MKRIGSIIAAGLIAFATLPALAQQAATPSPGYGYHRQFMWHGGFIFHPLLSLLIIVAIIALIARAFGWRRFGYRRYRGYGNPGGGALDILEERFARGEIDQAEFDAKRKALMR